MAQNRKQKRKKSGSQQNRPAVIHRYTAEDEDKKDKRKKLKIKGAIGAVALLLTLGIGWLLSILIF